MRSMNYLKNDCTKSNSVKSLALLTFLLALRLPVFCQQTDMTISSDSLSVVDTLSIQPMNLNQPNSDFSFDEVEVELYFKGTLIATLIPSYKDKINPKYIDSVEFEIDHSDSQKSILKIQLQLNFKSKGKFSILDYK
ncbi:MAG TPA: hypothetical protein VFE57_11385 [Cyclobacteriaceae bacterium]|nr:hypothetical protein [Cyclobacteriaceae bacterium]